MKSRRIAVSGLLAILSLLAWGCDDTKLVDLSRIPVSVRITVSPVQAEYHVGAEVTLGYVVLDKDGIVVEGIGASWQAPDPTAALDQGSGRYRLQAAGDLTWTVTLEAPYDALSDSLTLAVRQPPVEVVITVDPDKPFYRPQDEVALGYVVRDQYGQEISGIGASWQEPPVALAAPLGGGRFRLPAEGRPRWVVTLEPPWGLSAERELVVDGQGPLLLLETPERGDTLRKVGPTAEVSVSGQVEDAPAGLARLALRANGGAEIEVSVDANGRFALVVPAVSGLNLLALEAEDGAGNLSRVTRGFHYASDFFGYQDDPGGRSEVSGMVFGLIGDRALDRGRPDDVPPYDPCTYDATDLFACAELRDFASLLELGLNRVDFAGLQPSWQFVQPLVTQEWQFDLAGFATVKARLEGTFTLDLATSTLAAGEAQVERLEAIDGGAHAQVNFGAYTDSQGTVHPGLEADLGLTGTLRFVFMMDLTATDPADQDLLCILALNLCNPDPPYDCLFEYLESCVPVATPMAQLVSTISTPLLAGLDVAGMDLGVDLDLLLDPATRQPKAELAATALTLDSGGLDLTALEDVTVNLGTVQVGSYTIDLGTYQFPTTFISDLADDLIDPLLGSLTPVIEGALELLLACRDPLNPVCFVLPFFESVLGAYAQDRTLALDSPFGPTGSAPLAEVQLRTAYEDIRFRDGFGGRLRLAGVVDGPSDQAVDAHRDDDLLGAALADGCFAGAADFAGWPSGGKGMQLAAGLDMANLLLHAAWRAAGFDLDLDGAALGLGPEPSAVQLRLRPWLPPLLTHCGAPERAVLLGWGDVRFEASWTSGGRVFAASGFASLRLPADIELLADGRAALALRAVPGNFEVEFDGLTVDGTPAGATDEDLATAVLRDELLRRALAALGDLAVGTLNELQPIFDLGAFPGVDPAQARLEVGDLDAVQDSGRLILNGDL